MSRPVTRSELLARINSDFDSLLVEVDRVPLDRRCAEGACDAWSVKAAMSGFLVPRTRATASPAGWVHQSVAPTSAPGWVSAMDSVNEGTSDTARRAGPVTGTLVARSLLTHNRTLPAGRVSNVDRVVFADPDACGRPSVWRATGSGTRDRAQLAGVWTGSGSSAAGSCSGSCGWPRLAWAV